MTSQVRAQVLGPVLAQFRALGRITWLGVWRGAHGERPHTLRRLAGVLLVALRLYIVLRIVYGSAVALVMLRDRVAASMPAGGIEVSPDHLSAARLVLWALALLTLSSRLRDDLSAPRHEQKTRIDEGFLSALPLSPHARACASFASSAGYALSFATFAAIASGSVTGAFVGLALFVVCACAGDLLAERAGSWPRWLLGIVAFARALAVVCSVGLVLLIGAVAFYRAQLGKMSLDGADPEIFEALIALWPADRATVDPMYLVAQALFHGRLGGLAAVTAGLSLAMYALRVRTRRTETSELLVQAAKTNTGFADTLSLFGVERLLTARRAPWLARAATPLVCFLGLAAASLWLMRGRLILGFGQPDVFAFSVAFCMLVGGQASVRRASHAVRDDVAARPLLASLPIAPRATLRAKTALVQAYAVSFAAGPLFLAATFRAMTVTEALRLVELVIVLLVSASLAVSVAFLTQGNGAPRSASLGASTRFEQTLVLVPLFGVMFDEGRLNHAFAALSLVLLTLEARRAAAKSVRWTDDDDAQVAKQTPVWRALLVFGAFFPIQLVIQALSVVIFDESRREWRAVLAYASSGVVLALLTFRARSDQPSLPFAPKRAWWLAIGALSGLAAHGATMLYVRFVLGTEPAADKDASLSALLATFVLVSVLAPVVEEYYFRGWLQQAITSELPRRLRAFAFVPAAFAFSAVHVGSEHLPIFVLGLVAGALAYLSRSLGPAMLAHGVYNASLLIGATCTSRGGA